MISRLSLLFLACLLPACAKQEAVETIESKALLNQNDLTGWKTPENPESWVVEEGVLKVRNNEAQKGEILWTEAGFEDFILDLEFKFVSGTVDSGVHLRNDDQIQIGISGSLKRDMTGSPYISSKKGYPVEAEGVANLLKPDDWNKMKIEARGMDYIVHLNGAQVMTYTSDTGLEKGPVGLQLHAKREMGIDFRNIRLAELD
ncbi:MAG: DUF1080 domain-containing protein [Verrucomicrobiales bacterium]|nr:DUF1080 domain-containing protein [Verrucomicrobiales bacterium]